MVLTNRDTTVRANQVDIRLRNCSHADLVIGTRKESSKRAGKWNRAITSGTTNCHTCLQSTRKKVK